MANPEQVELLIESSKEQNGCRKWNRWRRENPSEEIDLTRVSLPSFCLFRANLNGADLTSADLTGADLWKADLQKANFTEAILLGANLRGTTLKGSNLEKANLGAACIDGADLRDARFKEANLKGVNFQKACFISLEGAEMDPLCQGVKFPCAKGISLFSKTPGVNILYGLLMVFVVVMTFYFSASFKVGLILMGVFTLILLAPRPFGNRWKEETLFSFSLVLVAFTLGFYCIFFGDYALVLIGIFLFLRTAHFLYQKKPKKIVEELEEIYRGSLMEKFIEGAFEKPAEISLPMALMGILFGGAFSALLIGSLLLGWVGSNVGNFALALMGYPFLITFIEGLGYLYDRKLIRKSTIGLAFFLFFLWFVLFFSSLPSVGNSPRKIQRTQRELQKIFQVQEKEQQKE